MYHNYCVLFPNGTLRPCQCLHRPQTGWLKVQAAAPPKYHSEKAHSPWRPIPSGFQTHAPSMMSQRHFGVNGDTLSHCPSSPTMSGTAIPDHTPQMALSSPPSCPCPAGLHHNLIDGESPCHPLHPPWHHWPETDQYILSSLQNREIKDRLTKRWDFTNCPWQCLPSHMFFQNLHTPLWM